MARGWAFLRIVFGLGEIRPKESELRPPRRFWFWFWIAWLSVFVVAETVAILNPDRGDTLSESVWFLQRSWWPLTLILAVLFAFLIFHFLFDRRSRNKD